MIGVEKENFYYNLELCKSIKKIGYERVKRGFDIIMSSIALIVLSPVFLIVAILIKLEDGDPVIYAQTRMTKNGEKFQMYKFRSMCVDAEKKKKELLEKNEMTGPIFKIKEDPRVTKIGRFIRKTSIDELPQLWNVLQGSMSIVGPRPPLPCEVKEYTEYQKHRLDVKTGLACYRECNGRSKIIDFNEWVELDLKYIKERGFFTDLKIILKTIKIVLTCEGAE